MIRLVASAMAPEKFGIGKIVLVLQELHRVNPGAVVGKQRVSDTEHESFHIPGLRILTLCMSIPVLRAANSSFTDCRGSISPRKTISVDMAHGNKRYYVV
jgi:hypothetical protein